MIELGPIIAALHHATETNIRVRASLHRIEKTFDELPSLIVRLEASEEALKRSAAIVSGLTPNET